MKKKTALPLLFILAAVLFSIFFCACEDTDEEEDCEPAPLFCDTLAPDSGNLSIMVSTPQAGSEVEVHIFTGELDEVPDIEEEAWYSRGATEDFSFETENGYYSAVAYYTIGNQQVAAIDGGSLSYSDEEYCYSVTCYEQGSLTLDLRFNEAAYEDYSDGKDDNCFIATAAYGAKNAAEVMTLRSFRDRVLKTNPLGRAFIFAYYSVSPPFARIIRKNPSLAFLTRQMLAPIVFFIHRPAFFYLFLFFVLAFVPLPIVMKYVRKRRSTFR